jgi:HSP20 family protein
MAIIRWKPVDEVDRLRQEVDSLFGSFVSETEPFFSRVYPAVNLSEKENNLFVRAELPGVNPESLEISVVEGRLLIRGERKIDVEEKNISYHRREREAGFFRRTVALPTKVDPGKVSAIIKNGVLTITLPKSEEAKPRKISVKMA